MMNLNNPQTTVVIPIQQIVQLFKHLLCSELSALLDRGELPPEIDVVDLTKMFTRSVLEPLKMRDPIIFKHMSDQAAMRLNSDIVRYCYAAQGYDVYELTCRVVTLMDRVVMNSITNTVPIIDCEGVFLLDYDIRGDAIYIDLFIPPGLTDVHSCFPR